MEFPNVRCYFVGIYFGGTINTVNERFLNLIEGEIEELFRLKGTYVNY